MVPLQRDSAELRACADVSATTRWGRTGAPPVNIAATDRAQRIEAMDEIKRAIEIAEQIPFRFLVQHIGSRERVV